MTWNELLQWVQDSQRSMKELRECARALGVQPARKKDETRNRIIQHIQSQPDPDAQASWSPGQVAQQGQQNQPQQQPQAGRRRSSILTWVAVGLALVVLAAILLELGFLAGTRLAAREVPTATPAAAVTGTAREAPPKAAPTKPTEAPTAAPSAMRADKTDKLKVNYNEPLIGTLDDFGSKVRYDDRFPLDGMIWDQSYQQGEILVGNAYAIHDHNFKSQKGCVVFYYKAPSVGGRVRFTGWNGQAFEFDAGTITLNQAIAAMRETLIRAHECDPKEIQYHELVRYGDPVK